MRVWTITGADMHREHSKQLRIFRVLLESAQGGVLVLKDWQIAGLVLHDPMNMGYLGVKTMVQSLRGEKVEKRISTGETLVTPDNVNDPKMQTLLAPPYQEWLKE